MYVEITGLHIAKEKNIKKGSWLPVGNIHSNADKICTIHYALIMPRNTELGLIQTFRVSVVLFGLVNAPFQAYIQYICPSLFR